MRFYWKLGRLLPVRSPASNVLGSSFFYYARQESILPLLLVWAAFGLLPGGPFRRGFAGYGPPSVIRLRRIFNGSFRFAHPRLTASPITFDLTPFGYFCLIAGGLVFTGDVIK